MRVLGKSIHSDGTLFHIDDKGKARALSEPTLIKYIQEGKVENASVVRKQGSRPFVRLASGVFTKEFSFPMPKFEQSSAKKEASIAKKWALAKSGIVNATASVPAKQRCVAFRFSGGSIFEVVTIALPESDVKGAEFALYRTLVEKCGLSKTEASSSASMASVWVVQGNAPKSAFKQIFFDPVSGFKIQCKAVEAVPTKFAPESHHIMSKQTASSTVKVMTREDHAKQAHGLIKKQLKGVDKKSVSDWKNDVIDWLSEHEGAYVDAMRRIGKPADYDPYDDEGLTDSDFEKLVGWICDHDQVSNDFKRRFETSAEELLDRVARDGARPVQSKKEYTGWQPTSVTFDEDGDVVVAKDDCIKVSLVNLDEGLSGDYDPDDPDDVNLLRFDVYYRNPEEGLDDWEPVDDASYCTNVDANSTKEHLEKVVRTLFKRYRDEYRNIATGGSVKKMGEELSHIS